MARGIIIFGSAESGKTTLGKLVAEKMIQLFLGTDDFWRDYNEMIKLGIEFVREPREKDYGTVAVFKDLYGNLWDLIQFNENHPMLKRVK